MADSSTQSIVVAARAGRVAAVICDFARYPEWVSAVKLRPRSWRSTTTGTPARSGSSWTPACIRDEYTLVYEYAEDISRIEWSLAEPSTAQRVQQGSYDLVDNGDGSTTVTYTLAVDLVISLPGVLRRRAEKTIMETALRDLKRRVESMAASG